MNSGNKPAIGALFHGSAQIFTAPPLAKQANVQKTGQFALSRPFEELPSIQSVHWSEVVAQWLAVGRSQGTHQQQLVESSNSNNCNEKLWLQ